MYQYYGIRSTMLLVNYYFWIEQLSEYRRESAITIYTLPHLFHRHCVMPKQQHNYHLYLQQYF